MKQFQAFKSADRGKSKKSKKEKVKEGNLIEE